MSGLLPEALAAHAPVLPAAVPLLAATIVTAIPNGRFAWGVALAAIAFAFACSLELILATQGAGVISYELGGWAPPLGIEFRVDSLNAAIALLIGVMGVLALVYALPSVADEISADKRGLFYAAFLICFSGLSGVALTGDAFNLFVFLEISSIATYALVAMGHQNDRRALTASFNYLVMGTIGATFYVIGVGFLYMATGTLNMADIAMRVAEMGDHRVVEIAFAFILVGIGLKAALFPLHLWLPNAYAFAPNVVTIFLASTATKVAFYVIIRFAFDVFDPSSSFVLASLAWVVTPLAIAGMIAASTQAIFQADARRLLAYSSVAQVGYMMLGLGVGTTAGVSAGVLHLMNHALMKGALFMALGGFALTYGARRINDFRGLGHTMPLTASAFTVGGLSLIGVPFTVGFISKFYLVQAALDRGWWWAVAAVLISSVLAVFYVYRLLAVMWVRPAPDTHGATIRRLPVIMAAPLWILALANLVFGVNADLLVGFAERAAAAAIAGGAGS